MFQLEVGCGFRKVEVNQALNRVEGHLLHRLGFSLVILWEIRQHLRSQDHR